MQNPIYLHLTVVTGAFILFYYGAYREWKEVKKGRQKADCIREYIDLNREIFYNRDPKYTYPQATKVIAFRDKWNGKVDDFTRYYNRLLDQITPKLENSISDEK
jgi:hypothetical protein